MIYKLYLISWNCLAVMTYLLVYSVTGVVHVSVRLNLAQWKKVKGPTRIVQKIRKILIHKTNQFQMALLLGALWTSNFQSQFNFRKSCLAWTYYVWLFWPKLFYWDGIVGQASCVWNTDIMDFLFVQDVVPLCFVILCCSTSLHALFSCMAVVPKTVADLGGLIFLLNSWWFWEILVKCGMGVPPPWGMLDPSLESTLY